MCAWAVARLARGVTEMCSCLYCRTDWCARAVTDAVPILTLVVICGESGGRHAECRTVWFGWLQVSTGRYRVSVWCIVVAVAVCGGLLVHQVVCAAHGLLVG